MTTSANSISFVITAIYTYTFGNAVSRVLQFNEQVVNIQIRPGTTLVSFLCVFICHTMALRFFFGNNYYVDQLYREPHRAGERLYHLFVIVLQSLILLGSSYLIRNPTVFFLWIAVLFVVEVLWYSGCAVFFRHAIRHKDGTLNRSLAKNEIANLAMVCGAVGAAMLWKGRYAEGAFFVAGLTFGINTFTDAVVNMKNYMGDDSDDVGRETVKVLPKRSRSTKTEPRA